MTSLSNQIVREVNRVRASRGLKPLTRSPQLASAAVTHSRSMASAGFFKHESADGSAFWKRIQRFYPAAGFRKWSVGENLVWSSPSLSAKRAVQMWLKSPPHRANLLSRNWAQIGLSAVYASSAPGEYQGRAATIVTADFGTRR